MKYHNLDTEDPRRKVCEAKTRDALSVSYIEHLQKLLAAAIARVEHINILITDGCSHPLDYQTVEEVDVSTDDWRCEIVNKYFCTLCNRRLS